MYFINLFHSSFLSSYATTCCLSVCLLDHIYHESWANNNYRIGKWNYVILEYKNFVQFYNCVSINGSTVTLNDKKCVSLRADGVDICLLQ